jgi:hypothetical protein
MVRKPLDWADHDRLRCIGNERRTRKRKNRSQPIEAFI